MKTNTSTDQCASERATNRKMESTESLCQGPRLSAATRFLRRLFREEHGPTAVEYAVMLALIVVACITSVQALSSETAASFDRSSSAIDGALSG